MKNLYLITSFDYYMQSYVMTLLIFSIPWFLIEVANYMKWGILLRNYVFLWKYACAGYVKLISEYIYL